MLKDHRIFIESISYLAIIWDDILRGTWKLVGKKNSSTLMEKKKSKALNFKSLSLNFSFAYTQNLIVI